MSIAQIPDGSISIPRQGIVRLLAVLVATIAIGLGCVRAQPVLRLTPLSDNVLWVGGMAASVKEGKLARVAVAFARQQDDLVAFYVEIENTARIPILVDPSRSYYAACTRLAKSRPRRCHPAQWVVDPEKVLLALDIAHARQQAYRMNQEFAGPMLFLTMGTAMAGEARGNHRATSAALGNAALASGTLYGIGQQQASAYEMVRANWEAEALRKTTLLPEGRVAGLVYIGRDFAANEVSLAIRIGDEIFEFPFQQILVDARRPRAVKDVSPEWNWRGQ